MNSWRDLEILFEDNHLIAVRKPSGMLVQEDNTGDIPLIDLVSEYIRHQTKKTGNVFLGNIHRLDRPVSGLVIFAKSSKALVRMNKMFQAREVEKTYFALVDHKPKMLNSQLVHWLTKDNTKNLARAHQREVKESKKAVLDYYYIGTANHVYLIKVIPTTGRPHQIRVQLSAIGCPIAGDLKYGSSKNYGQMIYLHAGQLSFIHPVTKAAIEINCLPEEKGNWKFFTEMIQNTLKTKKI